VLVDSEPLASRALAEHLTAAGYPIAPADCEARFTGLRFRTVFAMVEAELGRPLLPDFRDRVHAGTLATFTESLRPIPDVTEAIGRHARARLRRRRARPRARLARRPVRGRRGSRVRRHAPAPRPD